MPNLMNMLYPKIAAGVTRVWIQLLIKMLDEKGRYRTSGHDTMILCEFSKQDISKAALFVDFYMG